ncbi:hypothetical protein NON20_02140 [Synechocystis sp. B12]|nr:hypothetical protein NON20_02140 [Synechocystis sp. B12]
MFHLRHQVSFQNVVPSQFIVATPLAIASFLWEQGGANRTVPRSFKPFAYPLDSLQKSWPLVTILQNILTL